MHHHNFFATCPKGLESLLMSELAVLGCSDCRETVAGVYFNGGMSCAYRVCLWSRLANRVLLPLTVISMDAEDALYKDVNALNWEEYLLPTGTFRVDFIGTDKTIRNSQFGAVRVKDAVVDRFRARFNQRPSVAKEQPDLLINVRLARGKLHVGLDLAGDSLHRRGYRSHQGEAPLKENLAAALLYRCQWPEISARNGALIDPLCGAATLLIEGAMMAADIAPGIGKYAFGFTRWRNFKDYIWKELKAEAEQRCTAGIDKLRQSISRGMGFFGYDQQPNALQAAENNIEAAGLEEFIRVYRKPVASFKCPTHRPVNPGLVICNPPYGERLSDEQSLKPVYRQLGNALKTEFSGWRAGVLTSNVTLGKTMGIRSHKQYRFWNGRIPAQLLCFQIEEAYFVNLKEREEEGGDNAANSQQQQPESVKKVAQLSTGAQMIANRLQKNCKKLRKWIKQQQVECYRLYDADMPEYAAAIDIYGDYIHVQEYAAPKSVDPAKAKERLQELLDAVTAVLGCSSDRISLKQRHRNKGKHQYTPMDADVRDKILVREGRAHFLIDLWSYLDTGLFLDYRPVRAMIAGKIKGKRLLNLFCYTATATVQAALAGASSSVSVDMSNTYIQWARENFNTNSIDSKNHQLIRQDCFKWLQQYRLGGHRHGFDMILLDPPSFSNSKRMEGIFDVQRDHVAVINRCVSLLNPGGELIFSTNLRSFQLHQSALTSLHIDAIGANYVDPDFQYNPKTHKRWLLRRK